MNGSVAIDITISPTYTVVCSGRLLPKEVPLDYYYDAYSVSLLFQNS
jgi:hypothetical protein